jgi:hypothetical protein
LDREFQADLPSNAQSHCPDWPEERDARTLLCMTTFSFSFCLCSPLRRPGCLDGLQPACVGRAPFPAVFDRFP